MRKLKLQLDEVGYWSEIKLSILEKYAKPYNRILRAKNIETIYIDAFAGAGHHYSKTSKETIKGSPMRAMEISPPFSSLHFVDMNSARVEELRRLAGGRSDVTVHSGDANIVLPREIFPQVRYDLYRRGLCILDPYGLHLDWSVIRQAGESKAMEIFLNFPVMDMNMNVLWHSPENVSEEQRERMTRFWGDESWRQAAYEEEATLFGLQERKLSNERVALAFQERLKRVAGFKHVPEPMPMRNSLGAVVYYLFFAAQQPVASNIVTSIFEAYRNRGQANG